MTTRPTQNFTVPTETCTSSQVPSGMPASPPIRNGVRRFTSSACQIDGSDWIWAATEHTSTSVAATVTGSACSHSTSAIMPVPKPVRPLTNPPAKAPATISSCSAVIVPQSWEEPAAWRVGDVRCVSGPACVQARSPNADLNATHAGEGTQISTISLPVTRRLSSASIASPMRASG